LPVDLELTLDIAVVASVGGLAYSDSDTS